MLVCKVKRQLTEERAGLQTDRAVPAHWSHLFPQGPPSHPAVSPPFPLSGSYHHFPMLAISCHPVAVSLAGAGAGGGRLHLAQHPPTGFTSSQWGGLEPDPRAHLPCLGVASPAPLCRLQRCFLPVLLHPAATTCIQQPGPTPSSDPI